MMNMQSGWCSLEQSKKLVEAGLGPNTADMCYINGKVYSNKKEDFANFNQPYITECWSLGRLIELMPFNPTINGIKVFFQLNQLGCRYVYRDDDTSIKEVVVFTNSTLIDSVVSMVCWLLENNYIKKEETK